MRAAAEKCRPALLGADSMDVPGTPAPVATFPGAISALPAARLAARTTASPACSLDVKHARCITCTAAVGAARTLNASDDSMFLGARRTAARARRKRVREECEEGDVCRGLQRRVRRQRRYKRSRQTVCVRDFEAVRGEGERNSQLRVAVGRESGGGGLQ